MTSAIAPRGVAFALGLLLLWRILSVNAVIYGDSNTPVARVPADGGDRVPALMAELAANPASPATLVALGAEREKAGEPRAALNAFAAALQVAPIDRAALRAAAAIDAREGRLAESLRSLDRLATYYGDTREWMFPLLAQWLDAPAGRTALEALAREPSAWMGAFLTYACSRAQPIAVGAVLMHRVSARLAGKEELRCGIEALRRAGHWDVAYQLWLNALPRERLGDVGNVFNGSFELAPSGLAFDWLVDPRSVAHQADFPTGSGRVGSRALRVAWNGKRNAGPAIQQYLLLRPGRYELSGLARLEGLQSVRGVNWVVRCGGEPRAPALGNSRGFMGAAEWEAFKFDFEVPARCTGQSLQLEPVGLHEGATFVTGRAWFDELRIARID